MNPEHLMILAKEGDKEAFEKIYNLYFIPIYRYLYFRLKNKEDAEDLTQTVFLKVYTALGKFQEKGKNPLGYFFTVARNSLTDFWRKKKEVVLKEPEKELENLQDFKNNPQEFAIDREIKDFFQRAMDVLTEEQREVIVLRFINDLPGKEISSLLGKSEEAVRQLQCRGLKTLREKFKDYKIL